MVFLKKSNLGFPVITILLLFLQIFLNKSEFFFPHVKTKSVISRILFETLNFL